MRATAASPNPFRKTPQFHERAADKCIQGRLKRIRCEKGAMSKAGDAFPAPGQKDEGVCTMFKKIALSTAVAVSALTAVPAAAEAQSRYGYYGRSDNGYQPVSPAIATASATTTSATTGATPTSATTASATAIITATLPQRRLDRHHHRRDRRRPARPRGRRPRRPHGRHDHRRRRRRPRRPRDRPRATAARTVTRSACPRERCEDGGRS